MNKGNLRFEFGENWHNYSKFITDDQIQASSERLRGFISAQNLTGKTFLDIGSGSGVHSIAALKNGVKSLVAIDYDEDSVKTTEEMLCAWWDTQNYSVIKGDILDRDLRRQKFIDGRKYDIVYSWGVLHHTGNLNKAISNASRFTNLNGFFMFSVYGKTRYCFFWKIIKRWYCKCSSEKRKRAESIYIKLFGLYLLLRLKSLSSHINDYSKNKRGMNFYYDVKDWLGGYPYESISEKKVLGILSPLGFDLVKKNVRKRTGLFGSGCDEYLFKKIK